MYKLNNKTKFSKYKKSFIALGAGSLAFLVWFGFGEETYRITQCQSTVSKYVTAEMSSYELNFEGEFEHDYWSEQASEVYTESVINEMPVYPPMPPHDKSFKRDSDFDRFSFHTDSKLTVRGINSLGATSFTQSISKAESCLDRLEEFISVDTWYTITYSSDF